jgi:hypothetical protein
MKVNRTHDIHCHSKLNLVENGIVTLLLKLMIFLQCHPLVNDAHYFDGSLIIMMHLQLHQTKDDDESLLIV